MLIIDKNNCVIDTTQKKDIAQIFYKLKKIVLTASNEKNLISFTGYDETSIKENIIFWLNLNFKIYYYNNKNYSF